MASSINVPRSHLIMGLCLPLAVLLGYFVAQPLDSISIAVVFMVLAVLCVPLFMKWHHPLLVLCWNTTANPLFLPGRPALWMVVASTAMVRLAALMVAGSSVYTWLLARYGIRGVFSIRHPWRLALVLVAIAGSLVSGFRSSLIIFALIFGAFFCFEGLHRTRLL